MSDTKITLLIVDDHYAARLSLKIAFQKNRTFLVVGEAETGQEAVEMATSLNPNVIVLDFSLPGMDGAEAALAIKKTNLNPKILMLTSREDENCILAAFSAGVDGYCLKSAPAEQICSAVQAVSYGAGWLDPLIAKQILSIGPLTRGMNQSFEEEKFSLSQREKEVLQLIVDGLSNHQIAETLNLSYETVKSHVSHIFDKLTVSDRTQAAIKAVRSGLIHLGEG